MSATGSPRATHTMLTLDDLDLAFTRARDGTPSPGNVRETSSNVECKFLYYQKWAGEDQRIVEQRRRDGILKPSYWKTELCSKLLMAERYLSHANNTTPDLEPLVGAMVHLESLLLAIGIPEAEVERQRLQISQPEYWDDELIFLRRLKEETQQLNQSSCSLAAPTHPSPVPEPRSPLLTFLASHSTRPPSLLREGNARVSKRRRGNGWARRKKSTKAPEQQKRPSSKGAMGTGSAGKPRLPPSRKPEQVTLTRDFGLRSHHGRSIRN